MQELNFPSYSFRFKNSENKVSIFDEIRKKFIILTPEEWVRQHFVNYLITRKSYPKELQAKMCELQNEYLIYQFPFQKR
jgi:hypothetical protein